MSQNGHCNADFAVKDAYSLNQYQILVKYVRTGTRQWCRFSNIDFQYHKPAQESDVISFRQYLNRNEQIKLNI